MEDMEQKKIKAIKYCRVSSDKFSQDQSYIQQLKEEDSRFDIIKIFDDRCSGTGIKERVGFIDMMKYLGVDITFIDDDYYFNIFKPTDIKIITVANTSRFSRNLIDAKRALEVLHKQGVKVLFKDINAYSDNEQLEILLNIYFTIDQQYSKDLSRKVRYGMNRLAKQGYIFCTGSIKGYTLKGGNLTKNNEADKVYNIFEDYTKNNLSIRELSFKYDWNHSTIGNILKNKKYAGYNKPDDLDISDNIEPIITLEMFEKAQEIREQRMALSGNRGANTNTYGLSSKIKCPLCGYNLAYRKQKEKRWGIWSCYTNRSRTNSECSNPSISEGRINKWLMNMVSSKKWRDNIAFRIKNKLENLNKIDLTELYEEKKIIENKMENLMEIYLEKSITKEMYDKKNNTLLEKLRLIEDSIIKGDNVNDEIRKIKSLEKIYINKLDEIEKLILNEEWELIHQEIKSVYLKQVVNLSTMKKKLIVDYVTFKDIEIIDGLSYPSQEDLEDI